MNSIIKEVTLSLGFAVVLAFFGVALYKFLALPEVVYSNAAQACAFVLEQGRMSERYDCENMPIQYTTYWME